MRVQIIRIFIDCTLCQCRQLRPDLPADFDSIELWYSPLLPCVFDRHLVSKLAQSAQSAVLFVHRVDRPGFNLQVNLIGCSMWTHARLVHDNRIHLEAPYVTAAQVVSHRPAPGRSVTTSAAALSWWTDVSQIPIPREMLSNIYVYGIRIAVELAVALPERLVWFTPNLPSYALAGLSDRLRSRA